MVTKVADDKTTAVYDQKTIDEKFAKLTDGIKDDFKRAERAALSERAQDAVDGISTHSPKLAERRANTPDKFQRLADASRPAEDDAAGVDREDHAKIMSATVSSPEIEQAGIGSAVSQAELDARAQQGRAHWRDSSAYLGVGADIVGHTAKHMNGTDQAQGAAADKNREKAIDQISGNEDIQAWLDHERNTRVGISNPTTDVAQNNQTAAAAQEQQAAVTLAGKEQKAAQNQQQAASKDPAKDGAKKNDKGPHLVKEDSLTASTRNSAAKAQKAFSEGASNRGGNSIRGAKLVAGSDLKQAPATPRGQAAKDYGMEMPKR